MGGQEEAGGSVLLTFSSWEMFPDRGVHTTSPKVDCAPTRPLTFDLLHPCFTFPPTWCFWGCTSSEVLACKLLQQALFSGESRQRQHPPWEIEKEQENKLGLGGRERELIKIGDLLEILGKKINPKSFSLRKNKVPIYQSEFYMGFRIAMEADSGD